MRRAPSPARRRGSAGSSMEDRFRAAAFSSTRSAEMHLDLQAKLLRVLQERQAFAGWVAGKRSPSISASSRRRTAIRRRRCSEEHIEAGSVLPAGCGPIEVPPLRERPRTIPVLAEHFLRKLRRPVMTETATAARACSNEVMRVIRRIRLAGQRPRTPECDRAPGSTRLAGAEITSADLPSQLRKTRRRSWLPADYDAGYGPTLPQGEGARDQDARAAYLTRS